MIIAAYCIGGFVAACVIVAGLILIGVAREKRIQRNRQILMMAAAVDFADWDQQVEGGDWFALLGKELKRERVSITVRHEVQK